MRIFRLLVIGLILVMGSNDLFAQQNTQDPGALKGKWQLEKVDIKMLAQDNKWTTEKTISSKDSFQYVNGFLPLVIDFEGANCEIEYRSGVETGRYLLDKKKLVFQRPGSEIPANVPNEMAKPFEGIEFNYFLPPSAKLILVMKDIFYMDSATKVPVKQVNKCYYIKTN